MRTRSLTILAALAVALTPASADAVDAEQRALSSRDQLAMLYADQLVLDRQGQPLITVRVVRGVRKLKFRAEAALRLSAGPAGGDRVIAPPGSQWSLSLEAPHLGETRSWVVAERFGGSKMDRTTMALARWRGMGYTARAFQSGTLTALNGEMLDSRSVTIAIAPAATRSLARRRARTLAHRGLMLGTVHSEPIRWPGGTLVARELASGMTLRVKDLLAVSPVGTDGDRSVPPSGVPPTIELYDIKWPRYGRGARQYAGSMYFLVGRDKKLVGVNQLPAETLLEGVVPSEIYNTAPRAALQAQAIAARGMLLSKVGARHRDAPYLLCSEAHCQAYIGAGAAVASTTEAVRSTHGEVLVGPGGVTDTVYHSSCGGHSEAWHTVWGGKPKAEMPAVNDARVRRGHPPGSSDAATARFLHNPPEAWCTESGQRGSAFRWTVTRSVGDVSKAVNTREAIGPIEEIRPLKRSATGRVEVVEYVGRDGRHVVRSRRLNQRLLRVKSAMWVAEPDRDASGALVGWTFHGGGFGHGVGMCQHGAIGQARAGRNVRSILRHYYPRAELRTLW